MKDFIRRDRRYYLKLPNDKVQKLDLEELEKMRLNPTHVIPEIRGHKTVVSNYVLKFWAHRMKPQGFALYMHLLSMAFGEKDYAFPSVSYLSELTGISVRSVHKYLLELYELGFIIIVQSQDVYTNKFDPNIYMLTETVPFIPKEYYEELSPRLKKEHDQFVERIQYRGAKHPEYNSPVNL